MTEQIEFEDNDYIGCDYYGFAYESLVYSHAAQFTTTNGRTTYQPGTLVIVCARADDRNIYAYLATAKGVDEHKTAADFYPDAKPNPVNRLKVLTPITLLPDTVYSKMTQGGLLKVERAAVARYIRDEAQIITPIPAPDPAPVPTEFVDKAKSDAKEKIGYVYVIRNNLGEGYKIGITANIHSRFKALEVGTKAECIGYWSSPDYKKLEAFLHNLYTPERVPQSEWFMLSKKQLEFSLAWLDEMAIPIDNNYSTTTESWWTRFVAWITNLIYPKQLA